MDGDNEVPTIRITVKNQQKPPLKARVKTNRRLFKLLTVYCERNNLDYKTMRFVYDGRHIRPSQTPNSLHMRDEDEIEVMSEAGGGGGTSLQTLPVSFSQ